MMGLEYRELTPLEIDNDAPCEVPGSEGYNSENCRILAAINEDGEIVATWTLFAMAHIEPLWIREDYRGSPTVLRRMSEHMKGFLRGLGISQVYGVILKRTPVLDKFARWFGAEPVDGVLFSWVDQKE